MQRVTRQSLMIFEESLGLLLSHGRHMREGFDLGYTFISADAACDISVM
jgi:hypothetical protein